MRARAYVAATGSLCGDYHLGMHCPGEHHHHHHASPPSGLLLPSKTSMSTSATVFAPLVGGGGLITPSGCSLAGLDSNSGDHPPPVPATAAGLPGCNTGQQPPASSSAENDYFRTWQLQRHAAARSGGGASYPGSRSNSSIRGAPLAVGGLHLDSCGIHSQPTGAGRSPPEHIYESPKFERRDFLPPSSGQQQMQQPENAPVQHQCVCCAAAMQPPACLVGQNRCGHPTCGGTGAGSLEYYDLDADESTPRI